MILAGLLLKTGAYGLHALRWCRSSPRPPPAFAPVAMALAVVGILYGAVLAFAQTDLKRLVAYTSVSHMGFVLLGIFAWNELALQGAVMQSCWPRPQHRRAVHPGRRRCRSAPHTRDMDRHGRAVGRRCRAWAASALLFALASLGLPGPGQLRRRVPGAARHVSRSTSPAAALAAVGFIVCDRLRAVDDPASASTGRTRGGWQLPDLRAGGRWQSWRRWSLAIVWLGLYPQPVLDTARARASGQTLQHGGVQSTPMLPRRLPRVASDAVRHDSPLMTEGGPMRHP